MELWQKWEPLGSREEYHERVQEMGNPGEREREKISYQSKNMTKPFKYIPNAKLAIYCVVPVYTLHKINWHTNMVAATYFPFSRWQRPSWGVTTPPSWHRRNKIVNLTKTLHVTRKMTHSRNISHQQQSFWRLPSPGRSHKTNNWYSWVQTIYHEIVNTRSAFSIVREHTELSHFGQF